MTSSKTETYDAFLGGQFHAFQPRDGFRAGTDSVLLAAAIPAKSGDRILELGVGSGVCLLAIGTRVPEVELYGVDILAENVERANRNLKELNFNGEVFLHDIFEKIRGDSILKDQFDHVLMNPPFYSNFKHTPPKDSHKSYAHITEHQVGDWVKKGIKRLKPSGTMTIVFPAEGLADIIKAIPNSCSITILPVASKSGEDAKRVIVHVKNQSKYKLKIKSPLVLRTDNGDHTEIGENIARKGACIPL